MTPMKGGRLMETKRPGFQAKTRAWLLGLAVLCLTWALAASVPAARASDAASPTIVSLSLTKYGTVQTVDAGTMVGVRPAVVRIRVGDSVVFVNDDTDHHTATSLVGAVSFVDDPRWTDDALHATGDLGSGFWSTGDLAPGQRSGAFVAKKAGTYLFGCFYDYGAGMRGEIVVEP
jgi:plastocyanin